MPYWLITYEIRDEIRTWTGEAPDENEAHLSAYYAAVGSGRDSYDRKTPRPYFNVISIEETPRLGVRFPEWVEGEDPF